MNLNKVIGYNSSPFKAFKVSDSGIFVNKGVQYDFVNNIITVSKSKLIASEFDVEEKQYVATPNIIGDIETEYDIINISGNLKTQISGGYLYNIHEYRDKNMSHGVRDFGGFTNQPYIAKKEIGCLEDPNNTGVIYELTQFDYTDFMRQPALLVNYDTQIKFITHQKPISGTSNIINYSDYEGSGVDSSGVPYFYSEVETPSYAKENRDVVVAQEYENSISGISYNNFNISYLKITDPEITIESAYSTGGAPDYDITYDFKYSFSGSVYKQILIVGDISLTYAGEILNDGMNFGLHDQFSGQISGQTQPIYEITKL